MPTKPLIRDIFDAAKHFMWQKLEYITSLTVGSSVFATIQQSTTNVFLERIGGAIIGIIAACATVVLTHFLKRYLERKYPKQ